MNINTQDDRKLDITKKEFLKCFDNIQEYKQGNIKYWIINNNNKKFIIYEKDKVLRT